MMRHREEEVLNDQRYENSLKIKEDVAYVCMDSNPSKSIKLFEQCYHVDS